MPSRIELKCSKAPQSPSVSALLEQAVLQNKSLTEGDAGSRKDLLATARSLCNALETPMEAVLRMGWGDMSLQAALRIAVDLRLFEQMRQEESCAKSSGRLASMVGADPLLLGRLLKHMTSMGVLREADADMYALTPLSNSLVEPEYRDAVVTNFDVLYPALLGMPNYFAANGYQNPTNPVDGPFQYGVKTPLHYFKYLAEKPERMQAFNNHMAGYSTGRARWFDPDFFPVDDVLGDSASTEADAVMLVDIGGGNGRDISSLHQEYPHLPGRLILQDQSAVIKDLHLSKGIEVMPYNFFTPQPVKGARAYYFHSILHDWPDDKCKEILRNVMPAMTKGYSKLLINDAVIPAKNAHLLSTSVDMCMLVLLSATERAEVKWREILASVGLKVVKIWSYGQDTESLIEAELA